MQSGSCFHPTDEDLSAGAPAMKEPLGSIDFLGPESKTLYRIQNAMRYPHAMLPRCKFYALGIVCATPLLLNAQKNIASPSTTQPGTAAVSAGCANQIADAAQTICEQDDITILTPQRTVPA